MNHGYWKYLNYKKWRVTQVWVQEIGLFLVSVHDHCGRKWLCLHANDKQVPGKSNENRHLETGALGMTLSPRNLWMVDSLCTASPWICGRVEMIALVSLLSLKPPNKHVFTIASVSPPSPLEHPLSVSDKAIVSTFHFSKCLGCGG